MVELRTNDILTEENIVELIFEQLREKGLELPETYQEMLARKPYSTVTQEDLKNVPAKTAFEYFENLGSHYTFKNGTTVIIGLAARAGMYALAAEIHPTKLLVEEELEINKKHQRPYDIPTVFTIIAYETIGKLKEKERIIMEDYEKKTNDLVDLENVLIKEGMMLSTREIEIGEKNPQEKKSNFAGTSQIGYLYSPGIKLKYADGLTVEAKKKGIVKHWLDRREIELEKELVVKGKIVYENRSHNNPNRELMITCEDMAFLGYRE